ncbi:MAG: class I SAM-dependent methyltransferase [Methylococcales bacterium]
MADFQCIICSSCSEENVLLAEEKMYGLGGRFYYSQCANCGTLQLKNIPENLHDFYPSHYYSMLDNTEQKPGPEYKVKIWLRAMRSTYCIGQGNLIGRFISSIVPDYFGYSWEWFRFAGISLSQPILDVGCGQGALLKAMLNHGFSNLTGIDPFLETPLNLKQLKILKTSIDRLTGQYDFIMFHHSLEHMQNPISQLKRARQLCSKHGLILIRIPLANSYAFRHYQADWVQLDAPRHLFLPTLKAMKILSELTGFSIERVVFDSHKLQFYGSELYRRHLPLFHANGDKVDTADIFSVDELRHFEQESERLNLLEDGDQACFYLRSTN